MIFDANGNKRKHSFHRVMVRVVAQLSYQELQLAIEGNINEKTAPFLKASYNHYGKLMGASKLLVIVDNH